MAPESRYIQNSPRNYFHLAVWRRKCGRRCNLEVIFDAVSKVYSGKYLARHAHAFVGIAAAHL